jgi:glutathione S-transferase/autophagy-related protein 2
MAASNKLYGVPLSQPFRSVAWALLQKHVPFEVVLTVPGAAHKKGSLHESFRSLTRGRTDKVPVFTDGSNGVSLSESPAILTYLAERRGWTDDGDLYAPAGTSTKALIDSYLHWHHDGTRHLARITRPLIRPDLKVTVTDEDEVAARTVLKLLETAWLRDADYVAGTSTPSLADLMAYEEVVQAVVLAGLDLSADYPKLSAWMFRMEQLPFHDAVHVALTTLGNLKEPSDNAPPLAKQLGAATKAGMAAIEGAQKEYAEVTEPNSKL